MELELFFALFFLILLSFAGYHLTFRNIRLPLVAKTFHLTGTEFLLLGLLLGPTFLDLLDEATCRGLAPLTSLLLGWVGMLFGFQFEAAKLRRFPTAFPVAAVVESGVTFGIILAAFACCLPLWLPGKGDATPNGLLYCLAAAMMCTAQTGIGLLAPAYVSRRSRLVHLLSYLSTVDGLVALAVYALAVSETAANGLWSAPAGLLVCAALLACFMLATVQRCTENELVLLVIGLIVLASGASAVLGFSPLIANFVIGCALVNIAREKERIFHLLMSIEKPVYLMLLVFLGVGWRLDPLWAGLIAPFLCILRLTGKWLGGVLAASILPPLRTYPRALGLGLADTGGLPLAILFDLQQRFTDATAARVVGTGLVAVMATGLISPYLLKRLFSAKEADHAAAGR